MSCECKQKLSDLEWGTISAIMVDSTKIGTPLLVYLGKRYDINDILVYMNLKNVEIGQCMNEVERAYKKVQEEKTKNVANIIESKPMPLETPFHNHYYKKCPYEYIDVYRIIELYNITDPCLQHAFKKLLVAGARGHKDIDKDIQDVIDSCTRWQAMRKEDKDLK